MKIVDEIVRQFNSKECKYIYIAGLILVTCIFSWSAYLYLTIGDRWQQEDPLNKKVFEWNWLENCCSWWPITHLISFTILGFLFPNCYWVLFFAGVSWELFEVMMSYIFRGTIIKQPMRQNCQKKKCDLQYSTVWWAGSFKDIFFNTVGIILGKLLRFLVDKMIPVVI